MRAITAGTLELPASDAAPAYQSYTPGCAGRWAGAAAVSLGWLSIHLFGWPGAVLGLPLAIAGLARGLWRQELAIIGRGRYRLLRGWPWRLEQRQGRLAELRWHCRSRHDECGFRWFALELAPQDASWPALTLGHYASRRQALAALRRYLGAHAA
jgi:hypothetical protein